MSLQPNNLVSYEVRVQDNIIGSNIYTVALQVRNISDHFLSLEVEPIHLPGRLIQLQVDETGAKKTMLQAERLELLQAVEYSIHFLIGKKVQKKLPFGVILARSIVSVVDFYASIFTTGFIGNRIPPQQSIPPSIARALVIRNVEDINVIIEEFLQDIELENIRMKAIRILVKKIYDIEVELYNLDWDKVDSGV
jgi:hypothetical protein